MPKSSPEGSVFPGLEQEQRSAPHPRRSLSGIKKPLSASNDAENGKKERKSKEA